MPFKNYGQQRAMFSKSPATAEKWAHKYGTLDASGKRHGPGGKKAERKYKVKRRKKLYKR